MRSDTVKKGYEKAPHRALLRATGVKEEDFDKPFVAIVNSYVDGVPGHVHLQEFGKMVKDAVRAAGGVPFEFNTIGVHDGIAMSHMGMKYSLPSCELIADCVETMIEAHRFLMAWSASQITDRAKDVIKSGGEWISSVDLENCACGHAEVLMAAAIGVRHPKWDERPILLVVPRPGCTPAPESIIAHLALHFAKWQLPDAVVFVEALPMTATGKINKRTLRDSYGQTLMNAHA